MERIPSDYIEESFVRPLIVVISMVAVVVLGSMLFLKNQHQHISDTHAEMLAVSEHITGDITISHLWLEEIVSGDAHENPDTVFKHLNRVANDLERFHMFAEHSHVVARHPETDNIHAIHNAAQTIFDKFVKLTHQRLSNSEVSGISTAVDQEYDESFNNFIAHIATIRDILHDALKQHQYALNIIEWLLLLLVSLTMIVTGWLIRHSLNRQQESFVSAMNAEMARSRSEDFTSTVLNNSLDAIVSINADSVISSWNRAAELIFGWGEEEALGQDLSSLIIPEQYREAHRAGMKRFIETGISGSALGRRIETEGQNRDGHEFPVELSITHHQLDKIHYFTAFIRDISKRKHAERTLKQSESLLNEAQGIAKIGSWELDIVNNRLNWSDEIYRIFEIDKKQFAASYEGFLAAIHPDDVEAVQNAYERSLKDKEPYQVAHRVLMKDGRVKYVLERCENSFDEAGTPIRSVGTVQDISEKRAMDEKLEHVQRLESLGVMAGGIAHDFNNILTAIMGNAGLAERKLERDSPALKHVSRINKASHRATELCSQMLAYSGKGDFIVKPINLSELVAEISRLIEVSISRKVTIREKLKEDLPAIDADIGQMQQVIMNLITNAGEAVGENSGLISLSTGVMDADRSLLERIAFGQGLPEGEYVYLEVSDTGCGMDEETKKKIFDPFYTTKFTGRGLGMSAIQGIVRGHRGAITFETEVGKGSTFRVLFPTVDKKPVVVSDESAVIKNWRGEGLILVVDDDEAVSETACQMLKDIGYTVITASDGLEGLEQLKRFGDTVDAVLMDITMPRMDGIRCFSEMKRIRPDIKVVMSSGYSEQDATSRLPDESVAGFIQKPYTHDQLADVMKGLFNKT